VNGHQPHHRGSVFDLRWVALSLVVWLASLAFERGMFGNDRVRDIQPRCIATAIPSIAKDSAGATPPQHGQQLIESVQQNLAPRIRNPLLHAHLGRSDESV
jgi:hypothetical protein